MAVCTQLTVSVPEQNLRLATSDHFDHGLIEKLSDGFERLGAVESPFTLRVQPENPVPKNLRQAQQLHADRPREEQRRDELRSDDLTRNFDLWRKDIESYDYPGVDTLSLTVQQQRADAAVDIAHSAFNLATVDRNVSFEDPAVRGRYWLGPPTIELQTSETDFPGWRYPCVLAHELGHNADNQAKHWRNFYSEGDIGDECLFENQTQIKQARMLSERIRGEIIENDIPGATPNYRETRSEKAADAFAAMIIEPDRTRVHAPAIASRLESVFEDFFTRFKRKRQRLDAAWLS